MDERSSPWPVIEKPHGRGVPRHNLDDYATAVAGFSWERARDELYASTPGGDANIAAVAVDTWAAQEPERTALRFLRVDGSTDVLSYGELARRTKRFANVLRLLAVAPGEHVFGLLGRQPELYVSLLGTLRHRAIYTPLFSAFGPEPVAQRLELGDARVLITTAALYRRKIAPIRSRLPNLQHVLLVDGDSQVPDTDDLATLMVLAPDEYDGGRTGPSDPALVHFTSGTTGLPKGAVHVHDAVVAHVSTARQALDLTPDDVFWCTADPGWVTGTSYGVIAPLALGATSLVYEDEFDAKLWYSTLERERVTVWYTAPTALRMLMRAGADLPRQYDLSRLRFVASVGEPLNPEIVVWGRDVLGLPIHDNWWQTETGAIMVANVAAADIRPGSMGRPLPGVEATVLRRDEEGDVVMTDDEAVRADDDEDGVLALRPGWPSMFRGYLGQDERYAGCFRGGWYISGDVVRRDRDGYYWFVARGDDVIKSAGHLIGPFEVESALMEHPAVAEAGVIGKPDPIAGALVKAYVVLRPPYEESDRLVTELVAFGRKRLGAAVAPKEVTVVASLPHTRSGKIMRRLLKARELGLPEGDTSTLEGVP